MLAGPLSTCQNIAEVLFPQMIEQDSHVSYALNVKYLLTTLMEGCR